jgi:hypothetical protein
MKKQQIESLPVLFTYEDSKVYLKEIKNRAKAMEVYNEALDSLKETSYQPVVLGKSSNVNEIKKQRAFINCDVKDILSASKDINVKKWFKKREQDERKWIKENTDLRPFEDIHGDFEMPSEIEDEVSLYLLRSDLRYNSDNIEDVDKVPVYIAFVPTTQTYESAAYLQFGSFNNCPSPEVHVAIHKYWNEKYGFKPIAFSRDLIEGVVPKGSVVTEEEAMNLAFEMYLYCNDIVDQGTMTLEKLAESLIALRQWFFWWD